MFNTSFKKLKTVLLSASHSVQIFFRIFFCFSLDISIFHQCQSELIDEKGLFTPFYTIKKNLTKLHFIKKKTTFFSFFFKEKSEFLSTIFNVKLAT